jgi:hypothetical protein
MSNKTSITIWNECLERRNRIWLNWFYLQGRTRWSFDRWCRLNIDVCDVQEFTWTVRGSHNVTQPSHPKSSSFATHNANFNFGRASQHHANFKRLRMCTIKKELPFARGVMIWYVPTTFIYVFKSGNQRKLPF